MTQVLAAIHPEGILVATDSRAWRGPNQSQDLYFSVEKLFPLGEKAFIVSAGLGIGIPLSLRFQAFIMQNKDLTSGEILNIAGPLLSKYLDLMLSKSPGQLSGDPLARVLILIGVTGLSPPEGPHRLAFYVSEEGNLPMEEHKVASCITIPRLLGPELKLNTLCQKGTPVQELLTYMREVLTKRSKEEKEIGPPFHWGVLSERGFSTGQWRSDHTP